MFIPDSQYRYGEGLGRNSKHHNALKRPITSEPIPTLAISILYIVKQQLTLKNIGQNAQQCEENMEKIAKLLLDLVEFTVLSVQYVLALRDAHVKDMGYRLMVAPSPEAQDRK